MGTRPARDTRDQRAGRHEPVTDQSRTSHGISPGEGRRTGPAHGASLRGGPAGPAGGGAGRRDGRAGEEVVDEAEAGAAEGVAALLVLRPGRDYIMIV